MKEISTEGVKANGDARSETAEPSISPADDSAGGSSSASSTRRRRFSAMRRGVSFSAGASEGVAAAKGAVKKGFSFVKGIVERFMKSIGKMVDKIFGPLFTDEGTAAAHQGLLGEQPGNSTEAQGAFKLIKRMLKELDGLGEKYREFHRTFIRCVDPYAPVRKKKCSYGQPVPAGSGSWYEPSRNTGWAKSRQCEGKVLPES